MRVLQVFEPPDGGVPEHVGQLSRGLQERGHQVELAGPPAARLRDALEGANYHELPLVRSYGNPARELRALAGLYGLLRRRPVDLVHAHSSKAGVIARLAARAAAIPCVYTPHCYSFIGDVSARRRLFGTTVERSLARATACTICVCEYERQEALRQRVAAPEGLTVIYNGVAPCPDVEPDGALRRYADGAPLVGAVSVHRPQKGVDRLLDAAPGILERRPDVRFAVVGDGPLRPQHEAKARALGLGEHVLFAGFTGPAASYLRSLDVYVLPSRWEAFPIAVLEAMSCGTPTVATDAGGTREALEGGAGALVANWDQRAFEDAVVGLLASASEREAMSSRAERKAAERFSATRMVDQTAALYAAMLSA